MIGEMIKDRYKIIQYIGRGGMGTVYKAYDTILNRDVAIKMIKVDPHAKEKTIKQFYKEVQTATNLYHDHLVNIYDVDENEEYCSIIMELVEGQTLKEFIQNNHPIELEQVQKIMLQIVSAIEVAHEANIIHRDIKPQNILIDEHNELKVTDFGISKATDSHTITETSNYLGSVEYAAPEQVKGKKTSEATDIYALGIILFELLSNQLPFSGETQVSIALQHIQDEIPEINQYREVSNRVNNIILKATEKHPEDRFSSVKEMKNSIKYMLDDQPVSPYVLKFKENKTETIMLNSGIQKSTQHKESNEKLTAVPPVQKDQEDTLSKPTKKRYKWLFILLATLLVLAITSWFVFSMPREVEVPDYKGLTLKQYEQLLTEEDLMIGEKYSEYNDDVKKDQIIKVTPNVGAEIEKNSSIDVLVSKGEEPYKIEDFTGQKFDDVEQKLEKAKFKTIDSTEEYNYEFEEGHIISQSIEPDSSVIASKSNIKFTVSKGPEMISILDYTNLSFDKAKSELEKEGFNVERKDEYSEDVEALDVMKQEPNDGELPKGSTVQITVSKGPKPQADKEYRESITLEHSEPSVEDESTEAPDDDQDGKDPLDEDSDKDDEKTSEESTEEPTTNKSKRKQSESGQQQSSTADETAHNNKAKIKLVNNESTDVKVYISDKNHDIKEPVDEFTITEDTEYELKLVVEESMTAEYKIEINGEVWKSKKVHYDEIDEKDQASDDSSNKSKETEDETEEDKENALSPDQSSKSNESNEPSTTEDKESKQNQSASIKESNRASKLSIMNSLL